MAGMGVVPCYLPKLYYKDLSRDPAGESEEEPSMGDRLTLQTDRLKGETWEIRNTSFSEEYTCPL